ncbi:MULTISPECIES: amidohydrolase family protein [unclassified Pseudodesulfovibrio]|uniref:amidohydrolase family protein n=1 Tax=unclassified Pseudodesulfovibrio TaxID=2661612 RepID=UPI000FEBA201|nr:MULTISPECIES: amidohydrolase family protein [unclassified Pseudodesulfovibrio]MCJ2166246.1 amidohydrolase family protein [Pseudodesulfovibrio sp. S3-i]RWU02278.1 S-adenosylhomocysteine deaminase [Pseudodesulfovibrio sp. S3]
MLELVRAAKAATMVPGQPVIDDAAILVSQGIIKEVGTYGNLAKAHSGKVLDLGDTFLVPGLINAHSHLELAHLRGKCPSGQGFVNWVEALLKQPIFDLEADALEGACRELKRTGTVMVGDIATRFAKEMAGMLEASGLFFAVFCEAIGETVPKKTFIPKGEFEAGVISVAGHSLYTTHRDVLQAAKAETRKKGLPFSLHLAEHDDEVAIMAGEASAFLDLLQARGRLLDFEPPKRRPVQQAAALGLLDETTLAVHCVKVTDEDIETVRASKATVCLCPRSNEFIGVGRAPWEKWLASGTQLCLGTDSLASNDDLDLWNEAVYLKKNFMGELPFEDVLAMMTRTPAAILGAGHMLGTLEPGKIAAFARVPDMIHELF